MQMLKHQLNTLFRRSLNLFFGQTQYRPTSISQVGIFAMVKTLLFGGAMPVRAIAFDSQFFIGKSKVKRVVVDGELRLCLQPSFSKGSEHYGFKATGARPSAFCKFRSATFRTGSIALDKRVANHANSPADFAGHRVRATFVVITGALIECFLCFIRALWGAISPASISYTQPNRKSLIAGWACEFYRASRSCIANTMHSIVFASTAIRTESVFTARFWSALEGLSTMLAFKSAFHTSIIDQPRTESNIVYNRVVF